jgi:hypothetical protein
MKAKTAILIEVHRGLIPPIYCPVPNLAVSCDGRVVNRDEEQDTEDARKIIVED